MWLSNSEINPQTKLLLDYISILNNCIIYISDVTKNQYLYISPNANELLGFSPTILKEKGLQLVAAKTQEDDKKILVLFEAKLASFIYQSSKNTRKSFYYSYDYRFENANGNLVRILQQNFFIEWDENGNPLKKLGIAEDIDFIKTDERQILRVIYDHKITKIAYNNTNKNLYEIPPISSRQQEVLELLNKGLGSHEIGTLLDISSHTVDNHRRALLEKFFVRDTTALLWLARKWDLLKNKQGAQTDKATQIMAILEHQ